MRLFVGLDLPSPTRAALAGLRRGIPGARWIDPEELHLTLAFIGEVDGAAARDIAASLATLHAPAFAVGIAGVGHFGSLRRARAVWAGIVPCPPLGRLRQAVCRRLELAGMRLERRRFQPHVTLARIRGETGHHLADFMAEHSLLRLPEFAVESVTLFESHLRPEGATYRALAGFALAASPGMGNPTGTV